MKVTMTKREKAPISIDAFSAKATVEKALERVRGLGVRMIPRPLTRDGKPLDPVLPPDLTLLNDIQLGKLFSEFACMAQYVQFSMAQKSVDTAVRRREEKFIRAKVRLSKVGTVADKESKVEVDPVARKAAFETSVSESTEVLTEAVMQQYLIGRDACSREMTRRQWTMRDPNAGR